MDFQKLIDALKEVLDAIMKLFNLLFKQEEEPAAEDEETEA